MTIQATEWSQESHELQSWEDVNVDDIYFLVRDYVHGKHLSVHKEFEELTIIKNNMKVFQTNAALGYKQLVFLVKLDKSENGYNYLCIGTHNFDGDGTYQVGKVVEDLEDIYLEESTFKITDSELEGTYLFDYWLSNYFI